ncbi:hypothetical protein ACOSQ3_031873 [Xanthoceras sorbifolium]
MGKETHIEVRLWEPTVCNPNPRLPNLPSIIEPLPIIHKAEKTSISRSVRVKEIIVSGDRSHHFCDFREIPNTYTFGASRPSASEFGVESTFTLEESVDFMCVNARNFIWSTEDRGPDKLSNNDRMRLAIKLEKTCAENTALKLENERLWRKLKATKASVEDLKKAISKGAKAVEYKQRAK